MPLHGGGAYQGGNTMLSLFNIMLNLMLSHALSMLYLCTIYALEGREREGREGTVYALSMPRPYPVPCPIYVLSVPRPPPSIPRPLPAYAPSIHRLCPIYAPFPPSVHRPYCIYTVSILYLCCIYAPSTPPPLP